MPRSTSRSTHQCELKYMILIVVGMPGAGKGVFVQAAEELGFSHIAMGDVVRHYASENGLAYDDSSIGGFATSERNKHGGTIWAQRTIERMPPGNVIIDGSRSLEEIAYFKEKLGHGLRVIAIEAPAESRFERLNKRGREDAPQNMADLERRDQRELSWGLGNAFEVADLVLVNDSSLEEFKKRCLALLKTLLQSGG